MRRATKGRLLVPFLLVLPLALGSIAYAAAGRADVQAAVPATAAFHDLDKARAAGYTFELPQLSGETCVEEPGVGGMGVHLVNTTLLDGTIDVREPEVLVYERRNGKLKLAAVEYVVFEADWDGGDAPELFGRAFDHVPEPNRYGLPAFYALHAWIWKPNPAGLLEAWNPRVHC
jgi:hypothetical protein